MTLRPDPIRRLPGGPIDYRHYDRLAREIRSRDVTARLRRFAPSWWTL